jgi:hypothetical protein
MDVIPSYGILAPTPNAAAVWDLPKTNAEAAAGGEPTTTIVEQFPSLIDEVRLAAVPPDRPKLVEGLAALILKHAAETEIETELLSSPAYRSFRGTVRQRLIEFLFLSEANHRKALGAALFKNRDLRTMLDELGESHAHLTSGLTPCPNPPQKKSRPENPQGGA